MNAGGLARGHGARVAAIALEHFTRPHREPRAVDGAEAPPVHVEADRAARSEYWTTGEVIKQRRRTDKRLNDPYLDL